MRRFSGLLLAFVMMVSGGYAQTAKIVGTGAATCATFLTDIVRNPIFEREYFSWAQGYMSGMLMRAPSGKDEDLDLTPKEFPVKVQVEVFRNYCMAHPQESYSNAAALWVAMVAHIIT